MAGTTLQVRSLGRPGGEQEALRLEYNKAIVDLETIRSAVNTANGGAISITAASLTAGLITYTVG